MRKCEGGAEETCPAFDCSMCEGGNETSSVEAEEDHDAGGDEQAEEATTEVLATTEATTEVLAAQEVQSVEEELEKLGITSEYRVSLAWESTADLDIYVVNNETDETISYKKTTSSDGNTKLDADNGGGEQGTHVENISFNGDAGGSFVVYVNNHNSNDDVAEIPFTLVTKLGAQTETFEDSWNINEMGEHRDGDVGMMMKITGINF